MRRLLPLVLLLTACEPDARALPEQGALEVVAGRYGVAMVAEAVGESSPLTPARLSGLPVQPEYTVQFASTLGRLFVFDAPGPVVDLRMIQPGEPLVWGQPRTLRVRADRDGAELVGVAIRDGQVVRGTPTPDGLSFTVVGDGPLEVLVGWRDGPRLRAVDRRQLDTWTPEVVVPVGPTTAVNRTLVADVAGGLAGWVTVELTVGGVRTGFVLGEGLAGGRVGLEGPARGALQVFRPRSLGADVGLWVHATAREVGTPEPVAEVGQHLSLEVDEVTLRFPAAPSVAPAPSASAAGAPIFSRRAPTVFWGEDDATWIAAAIEGTDGCGQVRWQMARAGASEGVEVPEAAGDVLAAPLLSVAITRTEVGDLGWADVLAESVPPARIPQVAARWGRRVVRGYWRGGDSACAADSRQGLFTAQRVGECTPGAQGQTVVVDRCGRVVPIDAGPLACGSLDGDALLDPDGVQAFGVMADGEALVLLDGDKPTLRLSPRGRAAANPPPQLGGAWFRYTLTSTRHTWTDQGLGPALEAAQPVSAGAADAGPWVAFEADGQVRSAVAALPFVGRLQRFDGVEGWVQLDDAACADEVRRIDLAASDDGTGLVLSEVVVLGDQAEVRRLRLWRR